MPLATSHEFPLFSHGATGALACNFKPAMPSAMARAAASGATAARAWYEISRRVGGVAMSLEMDDASLRRCTL